MSYNPLVVGGGTEAAAQRVTVATDSTGVLSVDDNGSSLTVDGTVTANLSATDNAVLDDIAADTEAIKTAVEILDNIVSGSEAQVDVVTQPARARTTDSVSVGLATDAIMNNLTALTPKFASIAASSSGDNAIVAAVVSKKIRVLAYNFMAAGTVNAKWRSATTDKTGLSYLIANTGKVAPFNPVGWFETTAGEALNLNLSDAIAVGGEVVYVEV